MPKDRSRSRSRSRRTRTRTRSRSSPSSSHARKPPLSPSAHADSDVKEWDEVRCPVCMEQPHNTVLLICSSHDKGCRPFICDTSYRHSNCLDQYRKAFEGGGSMANLSCPLCRGVVSDWKVVQTARKYLNAKVRSCSTETCSFSGAYGELRRHARMEHPFVRPSEADPERQRDWRRMELQRDLGDFVSTIESSSVDGWEESLGLLAAEGREFGGFFPLPSISFFLILSFRGAGGLGGGAGSFSVRRGRGGARVLSGEGFGEAEASGGFQRIGEDDGAGHEEVLDSSRQLQRETHGQLRMREDDEDGGGL